MDNKYIQVDTDKNHLDLSNNQMSFLYIQVDLHDVPMDEGHIHLDKVFVWVD